MSLGGSGQPGGTGCRRSEACRPRRGRRWRRPRPSCSPSCWARPTLYERRRRCWSARRSSSGCAGSGRRPPRCCRGSRPSPTWCARPRTGRRRPRPRSTRPWSVRPPWRCGTARSSTSRPALAGSRCWRPPRNEGGVGRARGVGATGTVTRLAPYRRLEVARPHRAGAVSSPPCPTTSFRTCCTRWSVLRVDLGDGRVGESTARRSRRTPFACTDRGGARGAGRRVAASARAGSGVNLLRPHRMCPIVNVSRPVTRP